MLFSRSRPGTSGRDHPRRANHGWSMHLLTIYSDVQNKLCGQREQGGESRTSGFLDVGIWMSAWSGSGCHLHRPEEKISGSGFLDVRSGFLDVRRPEIWMSGLSGSGCCGPRPEKKYLDLDVCLGPDLDLDACLDPDMDLPSVATMARWHHQAHPRQGGNRLLR